MATMLHMEEPATTGLMAGGVPIPFTVVKATILRLAAVVRVGIGFLAVPAMIRLMAAIVAIMVMTGSTAAPMMIFSTAVLATMFWMAVKGRTGRCLLAI